MSATRKAKQGKNRFHGEKTIQTVKAMNGIDFAGNMHPDAWYRTLTKPDQRNERKPYLHAIILLAELTFWYRPRDEDLKQGVITPRFAGDMLQKSNDELAKKFGISKRCVRDALDYLENDAKVIKRHYRTINIKGVLMNNVQFIEMFPHRLREITHSDQINGQSVDELDKRGSRIRQEELSILAGRIHRPSTDQSHYKSADALQVDGNTDATGKNVSPDSRPSRTGTSTAALHPVVLAYKERYGRLPTREAQQRMIDLVADDLDLWKQALLSHRAASGNPMNYQHMYDMFINLKAGRPNAPSSLRTGRQDRTVVKPGTARRYKSIINGEAEYEAKPSS